jgi:HSP20 family protein
MIPVVRTYRRNPVYLKNMYNDEFLGGKMETYNQKVNVVETDNDFQLDLVAPGYNKKDIKVTVDKNELTIASVEQDSKTDEAKNKYLRREFVIKPFSRTFTLPENVEADKVKASHKNGILTISLPKRAKVEIPVQEIEIK